MSGRKKTASYRMRFFRCVKGVLTLRPFRDRASIAQPLLASVPPFVYAVGEHVHHRSFDYSVFNINLIAISVCAMRDGAKNT